MRGAGPPGLVIKMDVLATLHPRLQSIVKGRRTRALRLGQSSSESIVSTREELIAHENTPEAIKSRADFTAMQEMFDTWIKSCPKSARSAIQSSLLILIIALLANDVLLIWITTVHGSITVLAITIRSIFVSFWFMFFLEVVMPCF